MAAERGGRPTDLIDHKTIVNTSGKRGGLVTGHYTETEYGMAKSSVAKLADVSPDLADAFRSIRKAANAAGPLSLEHVEYAVVSALAVTRQHDALRAHLKKLLELGVEVPAIKHLLVAPIGAAGTLLETAEALDILDEVVASR